MRSITVVSILFLSTPLALASSSPLAAPAPIVFVCEHGNVKSLMAASFFNRLARERALPFRAEARGINPEAQVPAKIASALSADGLAVVEFKPLRLSTADLSAATRVISIGADLSSVGGEARAPIETWTDVPPASVDYAAARAAILRHIETLLDNLTSEQK